MARLADAAADRAGGGRGRCRDRHPHADDPGARSRHPGGIRAVSGRLRLADADARAANCAALHGSVRRALMSAKAFRVGLTGGIASGKSTVTRLFGARGVPIIDTDELAREVVEPGQPPLEQLVARFGPSILTSDGRLDRPALRNIVFSDAKARTDLEALTHPAIGAALESRSQIAGGPYQILVIPLLVEKNLGS